MKRYLEAGKLGAPRGLKGEIRLDCWCDGFDFLEGIPKLYLDPDGRLFLEPERFLPHLGTVVFKGYPDRTAVTPLVGRVLWFDREDVDLPEGAYFNDDLIGTPVFPDGGDEPVGFVYGLEDRGGPLLWRIRDESGRREFLFPASPSCLISVRPGEEIRVRWTDGIDNWYDV
ncbi:MAG: hypothetical protein ILO68_02650 [Clostridia bacterium]|nr:hypothetical protein [Clostridia bacterium]